MITERLARSLSDLRAATLTNPSEALLEMFGGGRTRAGVRVNTGAALAVPAFYAAIKILAETIGAMPCEIRHWDGKGDPMLGEIQPGTRLWSLLHDQPNPEMASSTYWEINTTHVGCQGKAFSFKQRDGYGRVIALWPLPPHLVDIVRDPTTRRRMFLISPDPDSAVVMPFYADDILYFRGFGPDPMRGLSPIGALRELIGRAHAEQDFASSMMANQARPSGVLMTDKKLDYKKGRILARRFKRAVSGTSRAGEIPLLEQGLKFDAISLSAGDAQFIEQRNFSVQDIARITRVPPKWLLAETGGSMHYTSDETSALEFLTFPMTPWTKRFEDPLRNDTDLPWTMTGTKAGRLFPRFKWEALNRVNRKDRYEAYKTGIDGGWLAPDDVLLDDGRPAKGLTQTKPVSPAPESQKRDRELPNPDDLDVEQLLDEALT